MYYNKNRVDNMLEEGSGDFCEATEELFEFINKFIDSVTTKDYEMTLEIQKFIDDWEGY